MKAKGQKGIGYVMRREACKEVDSEMESGGKAKPCRESRDKGDERNCSKVKAKRASAS